MTIVQFAVDGVISWMNTEIGGMVGEVTAGSVK